MQMLKEIQKRIAIKGGNLQDAKTAMIATLRSLHPQANRKDIRRMLHDRT
jgi:hypothetical protein